MKITNDKELLIALKEDYTLNEATGRFIRNTMKGGRPAGSLAGRISKRGYRELSVHNYRYREHRLVWLWLHGNLPTSKDGKALQIDHKDGDRTNNKPSNLHLVTQTVNSRNMHIRKSNTSGICGVFKTGNKWAAQIKVNYVNITLGVFYSKKEATLARWHADAIYNFSKRHGDKDFVLVEVPPTPISRSEAASKANLKPIHQFTLDGIYIKTFNSYKEARASIGNKQISVVVDHPTKTSGGYRWKTTI